MYTKLLNKIITEISCEAKEKDKRQKSLMKLFGMKKNSNGFNRLIGLVGSVFTNGPGDQGSIPGRVIPKTLKMVLDTSLFNTQQYKYQR